MIIISLISALIGIILEFMYEYIENTYFILAMSAIVFEIIAVVCGIINLAKMKQRICLPLIATIIIGIIEFSFSIYTGLLLVPVIGFIEFKRNKSKTGIISIIISITVVLVLFIARGYRYYYYRHYIAFFLEIMIILLMMIKNRENIIESIKSSKLFWKEKMRNKIITNIIFIFSTLIVLTNVIILEKYYALIHSKNNIVIENKLQKEIDNNFDNLSSEILYQLVYNNRVYPSNFFDNEIFLKPSWNGVYEVLNKSVDSGDEALNRIINYFDKKYSKKFTDLSDIVEYENNYAYIITGNAYQLSYEKMQSFVFIVYKKEVYDIENNKINTNDLEKIRYILNVKNKYDLESIDEIGVYRSNYKFKNRKKQ